MNGAKIIYWFPTGDKSRASSRIQIYNVCEALKNLKYISEVAYEPMKYIQEVPLTSRVAQKFLKKGDIVVFQKFHSKRTIELVKFLQSIGVVVVFHDCDHPPKQAMAETADRVIVPSIEYAKVMKNLGVKPFVVPDSPEKAKVKVSYSSINQLTCVWFGSSEGKKWDEVLYARNILKNQSLESKWSLVTISDHMEADIPWKADSLNELAEFDLAIFPIPDIDERIAVKSSNRMLQAMSQGLPVVASPLASYEEICSDNKMSNTICRSSQDWVERLNYYADEFHRKEEGQRNLEIARRYLLVNQVPKWIEAIGIDDGFKLETAETPDVDQFRKELIRRAIQWEQQVFSFREYFIDIKSLFLGVLFFLKKLSQTFVRRPHKLDRIK